MAHTDASGFPASALFSGQGYSAGGRLYGFFAWRFHKDYLKGKSIGIACPKLDSDQEVYIEKIKSLIDNAKINTLTVMIMQVPCCFGLAQIAKEGAEKASRKIPVKQVVVGLEGNILSEEWI